MTLYWCKRCGMVRAAKQAPICRHYAIDVPAAWMEPIPLWHPIAKDLA